MKVPERIKTALAEVTKDDEKNLRFMRSESERMIDALVIVMGEMQSQIDALVPAATLKQPERIQPMYGATGPYVGTGMRWHDEPTRRREKP